MKRHFSSRHESFRAGQDIFCKAIRLLPPETMKKAAALLKERCGEKVVLLATHDREAIQELGWRVIELG